MAKIQRPVIEDVHICDVCGQDMPTSPGWVNPYCEECRKELCPVCAVNVRVHNQVEPGVFTTFTKVLCYDCLCKPPKGRRPEWSLGVTK